MTALVFMQGQISNSSVFNNRLVASPGNINLPVYENSRRESNMRIGIDVDGVLADFVGACQLEFPSKQLDTSNWGLGLTDEEQNRFWKHVKDTYNWWEALRPLDEIFALLNQLDRYPNDQIFYVTSRVQSAGRSVMLQTQRWLHRQGVPFPSVIVKPNGIEKSEIYKAIGVEAAIDDYLPACGGIIQVLDRPWNQTKGETDEPKRVKSLREFFDGLVSIRRN